MIILNLYRECVTRAADKIPMISKETWQTISHGISVDSTVKFTKSGFSVKAPLLFKLRLRWSGTFVNLKEQFDNMSYRLMAVFSSSTPATHIELILNFAQISMG